ncbi:MAG: type II toxin-antitoxin system VapC family toxin [Limisphaerales bacterium]
MKAYFDSGFLFKLYWPEANSPAAFALLQQYDPPALLSRFNEIEMLHVARRKTRLRDADGIPLLTTAQYQAGLALLQQHLETGQIGFIDVDYNEVFDIVAELSRKHGFTQPVRTADLLHVAMMELGFDQFVTGDRQQHQFALAAGYSSVLLPP